MKNRLSEERLVYIEKQLAVFKLGMLQDFLNLRALCSRAGIKEEEVVLYVRSKVRQKSRVIELNSLLAEKSPNCPVCKSILVLQEINSKTDRMVDDHSRSWWVCSDVKCSFDPILSDKSVEKVIKDMGILDLIENETRG